MVLKVEVGCHVVPVHNCRVRKKGGAIMEAIESVEDKGVSNSQGGNFVSEGCVDSTNEKVIQEKGNIGVIKRCIRVREVGKGISWSHGSPWNMKEGEVKIL